jgi:hypothetical protein
MLIVMVFAIVSTILSFARLPRRASMRLPLIGAVASLIGIGLLITAGITRKGSWTVEVIGLVTLMAFCLLLIGAFAGFEKGHDP